MYENYATIRYSGDHCPFAMLVCCGGRGRLHINIILGYTLENPSRGSFTFPSSQLTMFNSSHKDH